MRASPTKRKVMEINIKGTIKRLSQPELVLVLVLGLVVVLGGVLVVGGALVTCSVVVTFGVQKPRLKDVFKHSSLEEHLKRLLPEGSQRLTQTEFRHACPSMQSSPPAQLPPRLLRGTQTSS